MPSRPRTFYDNCSVRGSMLLGRIGCSRFLRRWGIRPLCWAWRRGRGGRGRGRSSRIARTRSIHMFPWWWCVLSLCRDAVEGESYTRLQMSIFMFGEGSKRCYASCVRLIDWTDFSFSIIIVPPWLDDDEHSDPIRGYSLLFLYAHDVLPLPRNFQYLSTKGSIQSRESRAVKTSPIYPPLSTPLRHYETEAYAANVIIS
mmetsp:Transcript_22013/g.46067  ORF Transcript_22013/g.46067 Transcript_22013/m.46067 type:complete len:200 (+) Transcript_22013:239-838(+)